MLNDVILFGVFVALGCVASIAALASYLSYHYYLGRKKWVEEYAKLYTAFSQFEKDLVAVIVKEVDAKKRLDETSMDTIIFPSDKPKPEDIN